MNESLQALLSGLSPSELQEVADIAEYLQEKAGAGGSGQMAEGSVASLLNAASPRVRHTFQMLSDLMETPRMRPFTPKFSEEEHAENLGLDVVAALNTKAALDGQEVAGRVLERLGGGDSKRAPEALTRREQIAAALEAQNG